MAYRGSYPKSLSCSFRNSYRRQSFGSFLPVDGYRSWIGNFVETDWMARRGNPLHLLKLLCTDSDSSDRNKKTKHSSDVTLYPSFSEDKMPTKDTASFHKVDEMNSSNQESNSKRKRRERIPHTRERRDMFWRGVTASSKVEAHAGLTTFAMVVRSLEAKPFFTPPCSPPRQGYLLDDDYNLHIVASTASFGKKAVPRVRARRRLREACRRIFPFHAKRHKEYTITAHPVVLFAKWEDILADVYEALKRTNCYVEEMDS